jgi:YD repeat-containing protein
VECIKLFNSSNALLSLHHYTYDPASNVETRTDNGTTTTFGYDDIGQLTSESRTGYSATYSYDKNGNRLTRSVNGVTEVYAYDDADKLLNIKVNGVVVKSFSYDLAGRTTGITDSGGTTSFAYDYEDRLVSISRPGITTNTFAYNGFGARVSKSDSSGSNTYLRASAGLIGSIVSDSGATYTPGVSEKRGTTSTFYHADIKNSVEQTSTLQSVVASKQYDAFGSEVCRRAVPGKARSSTAGLSATTRTRTTASSTSVRDTTTRRRAGSCREIRSRTGGIGLRTAVLALCLGLIHPAINLLLAPFPRQAWQLLRMVPFRSETRLPLLSLPWHLSLTSPRGRKPEASRIPTLLRDLCRYPFRERRKGSCRSTEWATRMANGGRLRIPC